MATGHNRIHVLPDQVANQIAAGEVIERPASVVKELVENAIDAGARTIDLEIEAGGKRLIRVRDDGCGFSQSDAVVAFQRHATSKLRTADDLWRLRTLGFRGEALPSIASVSQFELTTREPESEVGTRVRLEGGAIVEVADLGGPVGTEVTVRSLFFNTPARMKFLRADATEAAHIHQLIERLALCHAGIAFSLMHNRQSVFNVQASDDPLVAVAAVYGRDVARQMIPVRFDSPSLRIHGFASPQNVHRSNRQHQSFFVNQRLVRSRDLTFAVQEAYRGLMDRDRHAIVIVKIEIDPGLVDVNVHPTKTEVRFTRDWEIKSLVLRALRDALTSRELTPAMTVTVPHSTAHSPTFMVSPGITGTTTDFRNALLARAGLVSQTALQSEQLRNTDASFQLIRQEVSTLQMRPLRQLRRTYILAEGDEGLYIVNQHRAHERVLLHQMQNGGRGVQVQRLLTPATVQVSRREAELVAQNEELFKTIGFELEPFGADAVIIRSIASVAVRGRVEEVFRDALDELVTHAGAARFEQRRQAMMTSVACHTAIKAGMELHDDECARLLRDLLATDSPFICPHGQPIIVSISHLELDRKFERI